MRIHASLVGVGMLAEFVPASFTLPENPIVRNGVGDFVNARFAVPQNPILDAGLGDFVAASYALPQNPILDAGVGDFVPTAPMYPIQKNSVLQASGMSGLGSCGGSCGCGGTCGGEGGLHGLMDSIETFATAQWAKIQSGDMTTIALWGGAALAIGYLVLSEHGPVQRRRRK